MRACKVCAILFTVLSCIYTSNAASADGVAVVYSIDRVRSDGQVAQGTLTLQVFNGSGGDLFNVDLRLETGGANAIAQHVIQFGSIGADEAAAAVGDFYVEQPLLDDGGALVWRIDYDDALSRHESLLVVSERAE